MNKAETLETTNETDQETALADDMQLTALLKQYPDFLMRHPELMADLEIPHGEEGAASLIERQVGLLRDKLQKTEKRMNGLLDIARDNDRLAKSRQRLALNLLGARDLDDVISTVLDELSEELDAEFAVIRLIGERDTEDHRYIDGQNLQAFSTMMKHRNPVCGRSTDEQKRALFVDDAEHVASAAIIPLSAGSDFGLVGLGSRDENRFHSVMGTDFLRQLGELISAALAVHLED